MSEQDDLFAAEGPVRRERSKTLDDLFLENRKAVAAIYAPFQADLKLSLARFYYRLTKNGTVNRLTKDGRDRIKVWEESFGDDFDRFVRERRGK